MKIELIGEIAEYYGEQNPDLAPLPKKGIVLSATEDELQDVRFPKMQGELALVPSETACNTAKMREAVEACLSYLERIDHGMNDYMRGLFETAYKKAKDALAAPPRNCDMPLVVDGPADNNADKAWLAFKHHNPDAYFDVSGLLRCIDWLLAPAAKAEGGKDERTKPDA